MIKFSNGEGFIKPIGVTLIDDEITLPEVAVGVFSSHLFEKIVENYKCTHVGCFVTANGKRDIYILDYDNTLITIFTAGVGGPVIATDIEDLAASGIKKIIIFGNCGVLNSKIGDCEVVIPNLAYREEGTSYHYMEDSETVEVNPKYREEFKKILDKYNFIYHEGPTWTTDAIYRETQDKINYFQQKGVLTVEMEGASIAAICNYLNLDYFTFYYAGDNLDAPTWEMRSILGEVELNKKQEVVKVALEMAKLLCTKR